MLTDQEIEGLALAHEAYGFGQVGSDGVSAHGFDAPGVLAFARAIEQAATAPLLAQIKELEAKLSSVIDEAHEGKLRARWAHQARETAEAKLAEKDTLLRQAMEALEGFVNIASDSQGVAGYHLSGDTAEWDEFDEVDAASSAIEAIRNHLGMKRPQLGNFSPTTQDTP